MELIKDRWALLKSITEHASRIMVWGLGSGTGKTHAALATTNGTRVYYIQLTEETPAAELRGTYVIRDGNMVWNDGPVTAAIRAASTGAHVRLVVDEIDKAGGDAQQFLLAATNYPARVSLPTGELVDCGKHDDRYQVIATGNANPNSLIGPLRDRFPVAVEITCANPDALAALPVDLRGAAAGTAIAEENRRISLRVWFEFARLRTLVGDDAALTACFGDKATDIADLLKLGQRDASPDLVPSKKTAKAAR